MRFTGVDHLGLTVTDLDSSTSWYCENLGFEPLVRYSNDEVGADVQVLRGPDVAFRVSLRRFATGSREPFDERRVGMDHVALGVADDDALDAWQQRLESAGITCRSLQRRLVRAVVGPSPW
ncbi:MAG: VOC family protein [Acidimicrobiales bacterium]